MTTTAVVIEHSLTNYSIEEYWVNETLVNQEKKIKDRKKTYEIKFSYGNTDEAAWLEFLGENETFHEFNPITKELEGEPPSQYTCWCECMEHFLLEQGYKKVPLLKGLEADLIADAKIYKFFAFQRES